MSRIITLFGTIFLFAFMLVSCSIGLQTYNKHEISFTVSSELKLEEYSVNFKKQTFQKGIPNIEQGAVLSSEKNFILLWLTTIPEFTKEEVNNSIITTPKTFISTSSNFKVEINGDLIYKELNGFSVTYALMRFSQPGWEAPGISAVWYCPSSKRTLQLISINKNPEKEMKRFISSFSDK